MMETDILVIGSGAAGMMAALTAAGNRRKCLILERGSHIAVSNATRAGGPALADTKLQRQEHAVVSAEQLFLHMYGFSRGTVNASLLKRAISKGRYVEQIFEKCGIEMTLGPDAYGVGFRARQMFQCTGKKRWQPLLEEFLRLGGRIEFSRKAVKAERGENGEIQVTAVEEGQSDREYRYQAKAVIIATGGYLGSDEMIKEHFGDIHMLPLGSTLCDGTGIWMALDAGGIQERNWGICANEFSGANHKHSRGASQFSSENRYAVCGGLLVNRHGRRFMNEQFLSDQPLSLGGEIALREGRFYAVLDADMYEQMGKKSVYAYYGSPEQWTAGKRNLASFQKRTEGGFERAVCEGWAFKGSIEEVVRTAGLPELAMTVTEYNKMCMDKKDSLFGKAPFLLKTLKKEPFYVFEYEPSAWCTLGGVKTDEFCRLLDARQNVIDGIFVAGVDNGSCYTAPYYDNEGAALGLALTTGVVAGEYASFFLK